MKAIILMAQTLTTASNTPIPAATTTTKVANATPPSSLSFNSSLPCQKASIGVQRRNVISLGIASAILGLDLYDKDGAWAAARRPPPSPPEEKKDPNVSGVQAKVLASKKRKEAMKQAMAKQRERGKKINDEKSTKNQQPRPPPKEPTPQPSRQQQLDTTTSQPSITDEKPGQESDSTSQP